MAALASLKLETVTTHDAASLDHCWERWPSSQFTAERSSCLCTRQLYIKTIFFYCIYVKMRNNLSSFRIRLVFRPNYQLYKWVLRSCHEFGCLSDQRREKKRCRKKRKRNLHISELNLVHYEHHSRFPLEQGMTHLSCPHLLPLPCMTLNKGLQKCLVTNRNSIHHTEEDEWKEISIFLSFCVSSSSPHHLSFWLLIWIDLHFGNFQRG